MPAFSVSSGSGSTDSRSLFRLRFPSVFPCEGSVAIFVRRRRVVFPPHFLQRVLVPRVAPSECFFLLALLFLISLFVFFLEIEADQTSSTPRS